MGRKWITALLTLVTVLLMTGCNSDQKDITEATEGFLGAIVKNDMETAAQYATEDFMNSDAMKITDSKILADEFFEAIGIAREDISEESAKVVDDYMALVIEKAYKDYEIQDIKIQGNTASVTAKIILGYDPDSPVTITDETNEVIKQYQTDHYDELLEIYAEQGEKEMNKKLYSDLIPIIIGDMQKRLEEASPAEEKTILSLEKIDGKWLVTDLVENRPQPEAVQEAGTGETAEEASHKESDNEESAAAGTTSGSHEYADEGITDTESEEDGGTSDEAEETTEGENED